LAYYARLRKLLQRKKSASELRNYRDKGPIPSTKSLIDALKAESVEGASLINIAVGIGAIQHELLAAGVARVTSIDASDAHIKSALEESNRRGLAGLVTYHHGAWQAAQAKTRAELSRSDFASYPRDRGS
jgi:2-polyprenyl-3-methyl-5-hydroxy-6-metoxy-1,4-benzoquinol methylase